MNFVMAKQTYHIDKYDEEAITRIHICKCVYVGIYFVGYFSYNVVNVLLPYKYTLKRKGILSL